MPWSKLLFAVCVIGVVAGTFWLIPKIQDQTFREIVIGILGGIIGWIAPTPQTLIRGGQEP